MITRAHVRQMREIIITKAGFENFPAVELLDTIDALYSENARLRKVHEAAEAVNDWETHTCIGDGCGLCELRKALDEDKGEKK